MADVTLSVGVNANEAKAGFKDVEKAAESTAKKLRMIDRGGPGGVSGYNAVDAARARTASRAPQAWATQQVPAGVGPAHSMWGKNIVKPAASTGEGGEEAPGLSLAQKAGGVAAIFAVIKGIEKVSEAVNKSRVEMAQLQQASANYWADQADAVASGGGAQMLAHIKATSIKLRDLHQELQIIGMKSPIQQFNNAVLEMIGGEGDTGKRKNIKTQEFMGQAAMAVALDKYDEMAEKESMIARMRANGLDDAADREELILKQTMQRAAYEAAINKAGIGKDPTGLTQDKEAKLKAFDQRAADEREWLDKKQVEKKQKASADAKAKEEEAGQKEDEKAMRDMEKRNKELADASDKRKEAEEKLRQSKLTPAEQKAEAEAKLKASKEAFAKMAPGLAKENLGTSIAEQELALAQMGLTKSGSVASPHTIASSKAELGLGGGTLTFGSQQDAGRQSAEMMRQIRDAVVGHKPPITQTKPLFNKP